MHTLLQGKARIFLKTRELDDAGKPKPEGGVAFTGEDWLQLTPVDRDVKLYVGQSRDVKVTQRKVKDDKANIRRNNGNGVVLYDTEEEFKIEIENFKKQDIALDIVEHLPGYWKMVKSSVEFEKKDAFTIEYHLTLPKESTGDKKTVVTFSLQHLNVQGNEPASY